MKLLSTILLAFNLSIPALLFSQKSEVYDELTDSFDYGKSAKESAASALDYIKKAYEQTTLDDLHYFVKKAKGEAEESNSQAGNAESEASDAESEADDIDCDDAEDEANEAEGNFLSAKNNADEAYTYLRRVEYSDDPDEIELNLKKAKSSLTDVLDYLNSGLTDLNDAIDELNDCE